MKGIIIVTVTLALTNVLCYHDPDLNYHLSQLQNLQQSCDDRAGYSYPAPALQFNAGINVAQAPQQLLAAPAYSKSAGYSYPVPVGPKISYAAPPSNSYEAVVAHANYAPAPTYSTQVQAEQREVHGYATSAGLSSATARPRTVIPQATYAQAPILAKITGAPLIAKFDVSPAKTTYVSQNLATQQAYQHAYSSGSLAKASLNSYNSVQHRGPVVTQLYAAPAAAQYAASPALKVQTVQQQFIAPANYPAVAQVAPAYRSQGHQYSSAISHVSSGNHLQYAAPVAQYAAPTPAHYTQYSTPVVAQHYAAPVVSHYSAQIAKPAIVSHYSAPAVAQYANSNHYATGPAVASLDHGAPRLFHAAQTVAHTAPAVIHAAPAVAHAAPALVHTAPAVAHAASALVHTAPAVHGAGHAKNVHKEFVDNYDAHPRYAFEYSVNDPHTGDIKQQKEERDGEVVKGQYSLVEPDGSVRTVNYVADWETGFHADVRNSKDNQH